MMKKRFYKTTYLVTVLSEDTPATGLDLEEIHAAITTGDCSGVSTEHDTEELAAEAMAAALEEQGSDPEYFGIRIDEGGVGVDGTTYLKREFTRENFHNWLREFRLQDTVGTTGDPGDNPLQRFAEDREFPVELKIDPALQRADGEHDGPYAGYGDNGALVAIYKDSRGIEAAGIRLGQDWFELAKRLDDLDESGAGIMAEEARRVVRNFYMDGLSEGVEIDEG